MRLWHSASMRISARARTVASLRVLLCKLLTQRSIGDVLEHHRRGMHMVASEGETLHEVNLPESMGSHQRCSFAASLSGQPNNPIHALDAAIPHERPHRESRKKARNLRAPRKQVVQHRGVDTATILVEAPEQSDRIFAGDAKSQQPTVRLSHDNSAAWSDNDADHEQCAEGRGDRSST